MNFELFTIGKTRLRFVAEGVETYMKRLRRYAPFEIREFPDVKNSGKISKEEQMASEGRIFLQNLNPSDHVILLDERGRQYSSPDFARHLQDIMASGKKRTVLIIGGPYGFSKEVYDRSNEMLSLSKMTFNHEMVKMFVVEQFYRAMSILNGDPYHHA